MSEFHAPIDGNIAIPGTYTAAGGTTNFHFSHPSTHERSTRPREPFSTIPFAPDADFVDRPEILAWVRNKCAGPGRRAALVGLGGVGKSQLAIQYAYSVRNETPRTYLFWVHASTRARFEEAYRGLADRLELPGRLDPKADVLRLVSNWLCDDAIGRWIMIVDNVDDVETFFPLPRREKDQTVESSLPSLAAYLPQSCNGSILITSRSRDAAARLAGGYHNIKEVLAMDKSQGLQLLRNKLQFMPHEEAAAVDLLHTLDFMPLVITQATAYINRRARMTIVGYLSEFRTNDKRRESLLIQDTGDLRRDESASNSVVTTWQMSFERIRQERPSAADLLSLMSFFNPQGIPEWILRRRSRIAARAGTSDNGGEADCTFDEDFDTLHAYSLITITAEDGMCEIHPLVQFCTRVWLSSFSEAERWKGEFIELLAQELPNGNFKNWTQCQQLLPHVEPLYDTEPASEQSLTAWAQVLTNAAWYLGEKGSLEIAQTLAAKALAVRERTLGLDDQYTLISVEVLAGVLRDQGKYDEAKTLYKRALEGTEKALGVHHPDTLISVSNLALVLWYQGKYDEAEKLNRRALEGREKELGVHHPNTLISVSNLASVLSDQGKYDEAEKLNRRALEGSEKELGVHYPTTLISVINLASVLTKQGKYDEAEKLSRRALEGNEKELGVHHPNTLTSVHNLASVLYNQGKYNEAEKLNRQALEGREKELGVHHPNTLNTAYNLARLLHGQKRYSEARDLYQRAYNGFEETLGSQHPTTVKCYNSFLAMQQEAEQAESVQGRSHFLAMEQEAEQAEPVQGRSSTPNNTTSIGNDTYQNNQFPALGGNRKRDRQASFSARNKGKLRRRSL